MQFPPEDPRNITFNGRRRSPDLEYLDRPVEWFIGQYCKLAFPTIQNDRKEYMWVKCEGLAEAEGEELRGLLDNDPQLAIEFTCGDIIEFSRKEILEVDGSFR